MQMDAPPLTEEERNQIYNWIDGIPLSRPKKNITRDFADGCMVAEIIRHFFPRIVEVHNYSLAHSAEHKLINWNTLNSRVLKKMGFQISASDIDCIIRAVPDAIERVLKVVQIKVEKYMEDQKNKKEQQNYVENAQQNNNAKGQQRHQQQQQQQQNSQNPYQFVELQQLKQK